jgi:alkylation response protein AidB-like acyl-CoA dehydrogenase
MSRETTTVQVPPPGAAASGQQVTPGDPVSPVCRLVAPDAELDRIAAAARARFGALVMRDVNKHAVDRDAQGITIPREVMRAVGRLGLLAMAVPEEHGGGGANPLTWGAVLEELGYLSEDGSFPLLVSLRVAVAAAIAQSGRADFLERYVRPMMAGDRAGAFAYTEDADAFSFKATAEPDDDGFVLNGEKVLVTGGATADTFMTYVRDVRTDDLLAILVERDDDGVELRPAQVSGLRSAGLCSLHLDGVKVPASRVLAGSDGLGHVQRFLNARRTLLICGVLGRMRAIIEDCSRSLHDTVRYGQPVAEFQNVQATLGRLYIDLEASRAIVYRALRRASLGAADPEFDPLTSAAKHFVAERAIETAMTALRLLGGRGYLAQNSHERYVRDFTGLIPGAGSQDLLEINLGARVVRESTRGFMKKG